MPACAAGMWTCSECNYANKARENECGSCPAPKPNPFDFSVKSNDFSALSSARRTTRSSIVSLLAHSSAAPTRRQARGSVAVAAVAELPHRLVVSGRSSKRKATALSACTLEKAEEAMDDEHEEAGRGAHGNESYASDDESLQQRHASRPKRHCSEQTQHRLNAYYKTIKQPDSPAPSPPTAKKHPTSDPAPKPEPLPAPTPPTPVKQPPPNLLVALPTAFTPPPLAPTPYIPATLPDTVALLNTVHATLALSAYPTASVAHLPSRAQHLGHVCAFLGRCLGARAGGALYVAGRPGAGKTLTVDWALQSVFGAGVAVLGSGDGAAGGGAAGRVWRCGGKGRSKANAGLPPTTVVTVNAIALMKGHGSFWCKLLALLASRGSGSREYDDVLQLTAEDALRRLQQLVATTRKRGEMIVLVVDEIDALLSSAASTSASGSSAGGGGSFTLLHALFRLVYGASSCVVLLSISNNITLLDAHCATLSAANALPERVVFSTYSQEDLLSILQERLLRCLPPRTATPESEPSTAPLALPFFAPSALDFICKATSKDTGDIRRCLRDCRHAIQQLLTTHTPTSPTTATPAFTPAAFHLTVSSLARVKAEREAATQPGRLAELSPQQQHVLWVAALVGGLAVGRAGEVYRACAGRVRGCGLTELGGGEVCAVLEMLESEGMVRRDKQGKVMRYVSVVTVERMRRQLRGDVWDALWKKADVVRSRA